MATSKRKCETCKKMFYPLFDTKTVHQSVCSDKCCVAYYDKQPKKSKRLARAICKMVGKRSIGEVRFSATYLEKKRGIAAEYERDTFEYQVNHVSKYTPDWTVVVNRKRFYIEYKGVLDGDTRKKMRLIKEQYPDLDIRLVFQRGKNKIYKGSKTTYMDWAKKHGFMCADNEVPKSWLK